MPRGEHRVLIHRPPDEVFETIASGQVTAEWHGTRVDVARLTGDGGVGTMVERTFRGPGPFRIHADYRVTVHDPPHRYGFELVGGPSRGEVLYTLEECPSGTTSVAVTVHLASRGALRALFTSAMRHAVAELDDLERLALMLPPPGSGPSS